MALTFDVNGVRLLSSVGFILSNILTVVEIG